MKKNILIIVLLSMCFGCLNAQTSAQILGYNMGYSSSMGNSYLGYGENMFVYTNPHSFIVDNKRFALDLGSNIFSSVEGAKGRQYIWSMGLAYKVNPKHAVFGGFRLLHGLTFDAINEQNLSRNISFSPREFSIDFGYAYAINKNFGAYLSTSFINSLNAQMANGFAMGFGLSFIDSFKVNGLNFDYGIQGDVKNIGPKLKYGKSTYYNIPLSLNVGGDFGVRFTESSSVKFAMGGHYYPYLSPNFLIINCDSPYYGIVPFELSLGAEYKYRFLAFRLGTLLRQYNSLITGGIGIDCRLFVLNLGCQFISKDFNNVSIGITYLY